MKANDVIAAYEAARRLAGTMGDGPPCCGFHNGWYTIGYGKYRRSQVIEMTSNLLARAAKEQNGSET